MSQSVFIGLDNYYLIIYLAFPHLLFSYILPHQFDLHIFA